MIEPTGYTALDLVGYTDKGTYAANVNYVKNDLVHYGGSIWRILIDDTIGITPAEGPNYTLFIGEPTNLVERIIAPLEDNPATVAYTTGRQIIYNDYLYEVIQNIAVGDILIAYEDDPTNANIKLASPVETQVLALESGKADNSVIAPVESGTTASRAYAAGAHFIRDGAFCTAKTAISQGETFTLNTNYSADDVGARIAANETTSLSTANITTAQTWISHTDTKIIKNGKTVNFFTILAINNTSGSDYGSDSSSVDLLLNLPFTVSSIHYSACPSNKTNVTSLDNSSIGLVRLFQNKLQLCFCKWLNGKSGRMYVNITAITT